MGAHDSSSASGCVGEEKWASGSIEKWAAFDSRFCVARHRFRKLDELRSLY
jgi:hypothetical protein